MAVIQVVLLLIYIGLIYKILTSCPMKKPMYRLIATVVVRFERWRHPQYRNARDGIVFTVQHFSADIKARTVTTTGNSANIYICR